MNWHVFVLVWGAEFVERFGRLAVPFLAMPGNIPALAEDAPVTFHAYTDAASRASVAAVLAPLAASCEIDVRLFDEAAGAGQSGPDYKYEIQRACVRDLARRFNDGSIVLLDSNFVLVDGSLRNLARRRAAGYQAATVSLLRVTNEPFEAAVLPVLAKGAPIGPRALLKTALPALHHINRSFFVDTDPFSPYPSQVSWRVGDDGFVNRNFLPHPLMIPMSDKVARSQSTMDYDLVLRVAKDDEIHVCRDSDEMLVVKFSHEEHWETRIGNFKPTPTDIGLFLLTCTNRRHRLFADAPVLFHTKDSDARFAREATRSQALIDQAYDWIVRTTVQAGRLDASMLMYLKSHLGPIEDFMSPQLEPAALARLL